MSTGYVYDALYLEHDQRGHPENRRRLEEITKYLEEAGFLVRMQPVAARDASEDEIATVHHRDYIAGLREVARDGGGWLDGDTYVAPRSYEAALRASGGLLQAVEAIFDGRVDNAIALVRPPGHHAGANRGMGFCLFNNVAIAARCALQRYDLERVLIVDFDLHHGNGTQDIFYQDPKVLFFSTHQYPYYPGSGHWQETGRGSGEGYTVNVPLPAGVGDAGYQRVFEEILVPIARRYQPQLILASAGYDAHWTDPLGMMLLSGSGYAFITQTLVSLAEELCDGRLALTLEGGYSLEALPLCVAATCSLLLGDVDVHDPLGRAPREERPVDSVIESVRQAHALDQRSPGQAGARPATRWS